jgi:glycosyltransferase involved in cell wall biosynthesis
MAEFFFHRLLADPLVTVVGSGKTELWPGIVYTMLVGGGRTAHIMISPQFYLEKHLPHVVDVIARARTKFSDIRFTILANTKEEEALARAAGIDAFLCNQNCFLDERLIYPEPIAQKIYDAVYNARLVPFKRHELAAETARLAIITGGFELDKSYAAKTLTEMSDLAYCNYNPTSGAQRQLTVEQVRRILVQSCCGLALSAREGAMWASSEYLLAGLPVVTTRSLGGRDVFFHPDYVTTVEDQPGAIATAVLDLKRRKLEPFVIRNRTIALFRDHRRRMVVRLCEIAQNDLFPLADASMWIPQFKHQLRSRLKVNLGTADQWAVS